MRRLILYISLLVPGIFVSSCKPGNENPEPPTPADIHEADTLLTASLPYNLTQPEEVITLPDSLREISGISALDDHTIVSVQDELGIVFFLDLNTKKIVRKIRFGDTGDFEGVVATRDHIFVLESGGNIFEISQHSGKTPLVKKYETGIPAKENEGFCVDSLHHQLLIGCKSKLTGTEYRNKRGIFGFDPETHSLKKNPDYLFDTEEITAIAEARQIPLPKHTRKKNPVPKEEIKLRISGMAFHPITDELYLLSAEDHLLLVFSRQNELRHIQPLDHALFNKPEGLTFLRNGELLISNEAQDQKPTLLRFRYQRE